jgi:hypothetical protein
MEHQVPYPYTNTKFKKFVEIPARALNWLLNKLKVKELFKKHVQDARRSTSAYPLDSLLMAGLQIHLFRNPSRHQFYQHLTKPYINIENLSYMRELQN